MLGTTGAYAADSATVHFDSTQPLQPGKDGRIEITIDSSVPVNAAQLSITYPPSQFRVIAVDTQGSKFTIAAEESIQNGVVKLARGNVQPLTGKSLFATLVVRPLTGNASTDSFGYSSTDSLVMSAENENVLTGSEVATVKPDTTADDRQSETQTTGFFAILKRTISEFFSRLFGR